MDSLKAIFYSGAITIPAIVSFCNIHARFSLTRVAANNPERNALVYFQDFLFYKGVSV